MINRKILCKSGHWTGSEFHSVQVDGRDVARRAGPSGRDSHAPVPGDTSDAFARTRRRTGRSRMPSRIGLPTASATPRPAPSIPIRRLLRSRFTPNHEMTGASTKVSAVFGVGDRVRGVSRVSFRVRVRQWCRQPGFGARRVTKRRGYNLSHAHKITGNTHTQCWG